MEENLTLRKLDTYPDTKKGGNPVRGFFKERQISPLGFLLWLLVAAAVGLACFGLILWSESSAGAFPIRFTEVLASNTASPNDQGYCCDYIELYNQGKNPVDMTGYQLGNISGGSRYAFPAGTVLQPGDYLVIYCSRTIPGCAPFEIARSGGEDFYLIASNNAVVDKVTTLATDPDQAMVRLADGQWSLSSVPTPGKENLTAGTLPGEIHNGSVSPVRITEYTAAATGYLADFDLLCDWIELHNPGDTAADLSGFSLSDNVGNDKYRFPQGSTLAPGAYAVVFCTENPPDGTFAPFSLSQTQQETLVLKDAQGRIVQLLRTQPEAAASVAVQTDGSWNPTQLPSPGFENTPLGHAAWLEQLGAQPGAIRISEVMAAQQLLLPDKDGKFWDWIELYNPGTAPVYLAGWHLTDDPAIPDKWSFPAVTIQPGEYWILFCSGQTRLGEELHCSFGLSAAGETLTITSCAGNIVDTVTFPESETNQSFAFPAGEAVAQQTPTPGYSNDPKGYALFCQANIPAGPLAISEVMTANDKYLPQQLGECYDWAELLNISGAPVSLADYTITDDPDQPQLYRLPDKLLEPGERIIIFLSGDETLSGRRYAHASFALNAAEDQLLLYGPEEKLLDYVYLTDIPRGFSYGRRSDGGFAYMTPSPLKENEPGSRQISAAPTSEYTAGVYSGETFTVALAAPGKIYYTTDGSTPDTASAEYTAPLQLTSTTVLRAVAQEEDKLSSDIYTATFVVGDTHDLPVVSLVTDPDGLWGSNGVYRNGDISVKEVRLASNVAYAGEDGNFSLDCEMSLHGATTVVAFAKKSFTLRFRNDYDGALRYDVFEDGDVTNFSSLLLRTSHESVYSSQMHDALMAHIASQSSNVLCQKYKYVAMYLNGEYWGLYALREHHSPEHYASYMEVPVEGVQMVRFMTDQVNDLSDFYTFCRNHSLAIPENYAYAATVLDLESFADWMIFQAYVCNVDIYENMRYYCSPEDGLWRCGLSDMDLGMCGSTKAFDELASTFHHSRVINALMENRDFQALVAKRMAYLLSGPLSDENMLATIDAMAAQIRQEAVWEEARWGTPVQGWENEVTFMKRFCDGRSKEMIDSFCAQVGASQAQREAWFGELE